MIAPDQVHAILNRRAHDYSVSTWVLREDERFELTCAIGGKRYQVCSIELHEGDPEPHLYGRLAYKGGTYGSDQRWRVYP